MNKDEILDKFAMRIILLVGFTFCVFLAGLFILLAIDTPWMAGVVLVVWLFVWSMNRAMKRDLRFPWEKR